MKWYFDNAAAALPSSAVMERLARLASEYSANQEASGAAGEAVRAALDTAARRLCAALCGPFAAEYSVLWTNTGTDAVRAAVLMFQLASDKPGDVLLTDGEHACVPAALNLLPPQYHRSRVKLLRNGQIDRSDLASKLADDTRFAAFHWIQSETGAVQDLAAVHSMIQSVAPQTRLLVDAIQGIGKLPFDFGAVRPDFLTLSGQKFGLPCGAALLFSNVFRQAAKRVRSERHAVGRLPPPFAMLLAETIGGRQATMSGDVEYAARLRSIFLEKLREELPDGSWRETIPAELASPYIAHVMFSGGKNTWQGAILTRLLAKYGASIASGSACDAETDEPSRALTAMGLSRTEAFSAVRISFFDRNTPEEAAELAGLLARAVREY